MSSLYELNGKYLLLQQMLDSEQTEDDSELIQETLSQYDEMIDEKVMNYCKVIRNIESDIDNIKNEIKNFQDRVKRKQNQIQRLKDNLMYNMKTSNKTSIKTDLFDVRVQKSGTRKLVLRCEPQELPEEYVKIEYKADNKKLREELKKDDSVCNKYCCLDDPTESLIIKKG